MVIRLMRLERKNWAGKAKYDNSSDNIGAFITAPHGLPHTGLSTQDADRLEKALRMEPGGLSPRSDFWINYNISIGSDEELQLDTSKPEDELIYLFLKNHMLVADGYANKRKNQFVQFVLFNPEEKAKEENMKTDVVAHAYSLLFNMSYADQLDALESTGKKVNSVHPEMIKSQLTLVVQQNPSAFVDMVNDKDYKVKLFILKCVSNGVVVKTKNNIETAVFYYGDEYLGMGIQEVVSKLQTNSAQGIYIGMTRALESKQRAMMVDNHAVAPVPSPAPVYVQPVAATMPVESVYVEPAPKPAPAPVSTQPLNLPDLAEARKAMEPTKSRAKTGKKVISGSAALEAAKNALPSVPPSPPAKKAKNVKGGDSDVEYDQDPTIL